MTHRFQSTPPARGATQKKELSCCWINISIHAPREGGDPVGLRDLPVVRAFQSTPPARGATASRPFRAYPRVDFNPRPPRGGRHGRYPDVSFQCVISIHAPREGGDGACILYTALTARFQSTPPARGATAKMHSFTCGSLTNK